MHLAHSRTAGGDRRSYAEAGVKACICVLLTSYLTLDEFAGRAPAV